MNFYQPPHQKNCKVVRSKQMQEIDRITIQEIGVPGIVLMENAGRITAHEIDQLIPVSSRRDEVRTAFIFTGKGNNGGDGFVIARHLVNWGWRVELFLLAGVEDLSGDARTNAEICRRLGYPMHLITPENLTEGRIEGGQVDILVDAILGTGIKGAVRGLAADVIKVMNQSQIPIVAVDVPSGLNTDTGRVEGACIRAVMTFTMGLPKIGQLIPDGINYVGDLRVLDIGFPPHLTQDDAIQTELLTAGYISHLLPQRDIDAHKGSCGKVLVVAGSPGMTGAAVMCCQSAYLSGAGYVTLAMPESINQIMEIKLTEVVKKSLPQTDTGCLHSDAFSVIMELVEKCDAVAIGPGVSQHVETEKLLTKLVETIDKPIVIDADGLNLLANDVSLLDRKQTAQLVLTPHIGEMARLTGLSMADIAADRVEIGRKMAREWDVTLVLKGAGSIIASPAGEVMINSTGNSGMATAGSGDVLTGMILTFLAQGLTASQAAQVGCYLHGKAGDFAAEQIGQRSLMATDILEWIPASLRTW